MSTIEFSIFFTQLKVYITQIHVRVQIFLSPVLLAQNWLYRSQAQNKEKNFRSASEKETNPQVSVDILKRDDLLSIYGFVYDLEQEEGGLSSSDGGRYFFGANQPIVD